MSVAIVVPVHVEHSHARATIAGWVTERLRALHDGWPILRAGDGGLEPWSKSLAVNAGVRALRAEIATVVVHDADVVVSSGALRRAVRAVSEGEPWAVPHGTVYRLGSAATAEALRCTSYTIEPDHVPESQHEHLDRPPYEGLPGGGLFVVRRDVWDTIGGFDERFRGWGSEDVSLGWALDTLAGPHWQGDAPLWHLRHPMEPRTTAMYANQRLEERYRKANGDRAAMLALVALRPSLAR